VLHVLRMMSHVRYMADDHIQSAAIYVAADRNLEVNVKRVSCKRTKLNRVDGVSRPAFKHLKSDFTLGCLGISRWLRQVT
jgi:hypothetical protein